MGQTIVTPAKAGAAMFVARRPYSNSTTPAFAGVTE